MTSPLRCLAVLGGALVLPLVARGQQGSAIIFGAVVNRATQGPIPNTLIVHQGDGRIVRSDSLGYFQFRSLGAGIVRFDVRAPGYPLAILTVALVNGERMERDIELDSTAQLAPSGKTTVLPGVAVEVAPSLGLRYRDFERRRDSGRGHYLTRAQIEAKSANNLQDALRDVRGIVLECGGGTGCYLRMARAPMQCLPKYIVDEREDDFFGPTVAVRDIEALEVYTGPSDVPGEFAGSDAGCGVIVIWTRSGPPRKKKK